MQSHIISYPNPTNTATPPSAPTPSKPHTQKRKRKRGSNHATILPQPCSQHAPNHPKRHHQVTLSTSITTTPTCTDTAQLQGSTRTHDTHCKDAIMEIIASSTHPSVKDQVVKLQHTCINFQQLLCIKVIILQRTINGFSYTVDES